MLADIAGADGAQQCVRDCVTQNIRVRKSFEAVRMRNCDTAENQLSIFSQTMDVVTDSAPNHRFHNFKSITPFDATMLYLSFISSRGRRSTLPPALSIKSHPAAISHKLIPRSM